MVVAPRQVLDSQGRYWVLFPADHEAGSATISGRDSARDLMPSSARGVLIGLPLRASRASVAWTIAFTLEVADMDLGREVVKSTS